MQALRFYPGSLLFTLTGSSLSRAHDPRKYTPIRSTEHLWPGVTSGCDHLGELVVGVPCGRQKEPQGPGRQNLLVPCIDRPSGRVVALRPRGIRLC